MTLLDRVVQLLADRAVPHALIGAAALAVRGIARSTFDIDLLTTDRRVLDAQWWMPLADEGATATVRVGDSDDPLAGVVRLDAVADRPVDLVVGRHAWQARAVARAERSPHTLPVVTAHDLVLLKLYAGGAQDLWDVRELLRQPGADALMASVDAEISGMPSAMKDAWEQTR